MADRMFGWSLPPGVSQADIDRAAGVDDEAHEEAFIQTLTEALERKAQEKKQEAERMDAGTPGFNYALTDMHKYKLAALELRHSLEQDEHWLLMLVREAMSLAYEEGVGVGMSDEAQARDFEETGRAADRWPLEQELLEAAQLASGTLGAIAQDVGDGLYTSPKIAAIKSTGQVSLRLQTALNAWKGKS